MGELGTYRSKRDFSRTREPAGRKARGKERFFIVQKHAATRLHYDFRLAIGGVLVSWAVTKGPSLDPSERRLAVRTEDHPMAYADFEGTIPKGEYGGGTVMLWDRGAYEPVGDPEEGLAEGHLKLRLHGERLQGGFALVRMKPRKGEKRENWLLIKERDEAVDEDRDLGREDRSVASGRSMAEIAEGDEVWHSDRDGSATSTADKARTKRKAGKAAKPKAKAGGRPPAFAKPQLATLVDEAPEGAGWLFETKFDGYRVLAACDGQAVRCYTRSGADWSDRFGRIPEALAALDLSGSLLDGEVVVADSKGGSDFSALQRALKEAPQKLAYVVFDALLLDGEDLTGRPLGERKQRLEAALGKPKPPLHLATWIEGDGARVAALACRQGHEGIIAKRVSAPYRARRTLDWLKIKCVKREEFVIGGWSPSDRKRPFSSLLLGLYQDGALRYAGRVGTGFDEATLQDLGARLGKLERKTPPFESVPADQKRSARWVTPSLVAEVRYAELTRDGIVRHGVFEGLREDKKPEEVTGERPAPVEEAAAAGGRTRTKAGKERTGVAKNAQDGPAKVAGVSLSNPERVLFPSMNVTKRALAEYFDGVAELMLPELDGRPVSLVRCPEGSRKECFFQKHAGPSLPDSIGTVSIAEKKGGKKDYLVVESREALVGCAQIGALELHLWAARRDRIERPDRLVFDLDPGEGVGFAEVRRAAVDIAAMLREGGLESAPLLTGGKGVHLVVALERRQDWAAFAGFAKAFAAKLEELDPKRFVATMSKAKRGGRIFVDHFRNQRGSTAICPFSPRAREGAPAAVPVSWSELDGIKSADAFTLETVLDDLKGRGRAWADVPAGQRLTKAGAAKLGIALAE